MNSIKSISLPEHLTPYFRECYFCSFESRDSPYIPVVDDGCHDLVIFRELNSSFIYGEDKKVIPLTFPVFTIQGVEHPFRIQINGTLHFTTLKVQPWLNTAFFPMGKSAGVIDMGRMYPEAESALVPGLLNEKEEAQIKKLVVDFMELMVARIQPETDELIRSVCTRIYEAKGMISVNQLSEEFEYSRQALNNRFKKRVFYGLKHFIMIVRIMSLIKRKVNHPEISFTRLAHTFQYFDQAHFNRDFKKVTGLEPKVFFADLSPFLVRHLKTPPDPC
ncbi:helix-turn-helix domain-containing protein [Robertkochia aurantiaca]|uniref:helix-turn-helix domain-containing protein n=1 Tax=Robertkochia aurantiaca TaxID=2873700 RepID=UPI001CCFB835|nr:helix-turn-helix domain-containing protein [Robertkochia sp. 3YJGBD-33]